MDWTVVVLVLILIALWSIKDALGKIAWHLIQISTSIDQKPVSQSSSMSGVEGQLSKIVELLEGEEKIKALKDKKRKQLKERLVKAYVKQGKTPTQANNEVDKLIDEAEFAEEHEGYSIDYSKGFYGLEQWVNAVEVEERYQKNYGHLLDKARNYLKNKTIIQPNELKLREALETDYYGEQWLIQKLIQEKRLEKIGEYSTQEERYVLEHYKVLETQK